MNKILLEIQLLNAFLGSYLQSALNIPVEYFEIEISWELDSKHLHELNSVNYVFQKNIFSFQVGFLTSDPFGEVQTQPFSSAFWSSACSSASTD